MNQTTDNKEAKKVQVLENKKVSIVPIPRNTQWGPTHEVKLSLYEGAERSYSAPKNSLTGQWHKFLSNDEIAEFERLLSRKPGDLNFYDKNNSFWKSFRVGVPNEGKVFDLSDALENLQFRILKLYKTIIAPSWDERTAHNGYIFAIVEEGYKEKEKASKVDKLKEAYTFYGTIQEDKNKLSHVLKAYGVSKNEEKLVPKTRKHEWLKAEVGKIIEQDIDGFIAISKDPDFDWKVLVHCALEARALIKPSKSAYALPGGDVIGKGIEETISYLKDPENNSVLTTIKARIEAA